MLESIDRAKGLIESLPYMQEFRHKTVVIKYGGHAMVDENLSALNMPTRKEVRTLQARMQENRREIKALRAELDALKLQQVKAVVAPPVKSAPKRKTTPRKKTASRKKTTVKK